MSPRRPVLLRMSATRLEHHVALLVPVGVVVVLEVVEVEEDQRHRVPGVPRALDLELQALAEEADVVEAGEGIGDGPAVPARDPAGEVADALELEPVQLLEHVGPRAQQLAEAPRPGCAGPGPRDRARTVAERAWPSRAAISPTTATGSIVRSTSRSPSTGSWVTSRSALQEEDHVVAGVALAPEEGAPGRESSSPRGLDLPRAGRSWVYRSVYASGVSAV